MNFENFQIFEFEIEFKNSVTKMIKFMLFHLMNSTSNIIILHLKMNCYREFRCYFSVGDKFCLE